MKKFKRVILGVATIVAGTVCGFGGCLQQAKDGCQWDFDNGSFAYQCSGNMDLPDILDPIL